MSPRLTRLRVENYRSIRGKHAINLDAPVVLIHGANGSGKTSLLSAIEMGLTGAAAAMRRADETYTEHLVHTGAVEASIEVRCRHDRLDLTDDTLLIKDGEILGKPHLPEPVRRFYKERCFLAQATLSRLLDIYQPTSSKADDALTQFVRDLIGLDQFDSLLAGLHHTRDRRRLRIAVPAFGAAEEKAKSLADELSGIEETRKEKQEEIGTLETNLREYLEALGLTSDLKSKALSDVLVQSSDVDEAKRLRALEREIASADTQWHEFSQTVNVEALSDAERAVTATVTEMAEWEGRHRESIDVALSKARALVETVPTVESAGVTGAVLYALDRIDDELERAEAEHELNQNMVDRLSESRVTAEKADGRITRLDGRIAQIAGDSGTLARALSEIEPFVKDEVCPVCHRDFSETSDLTLHGHLTAHIAALATAANDLRTATAERQAEVRTRDNARTVIDDLEKRLPSSEVKATTDRRRTLLAESKTALATIQDAVEVGGMLEAKSAEATSRLTTLRRHERTLEGLRNSIQGIPEQAGLAAPAPGEGISSVLERCGQNVRKQLTKLEERVAERSAAKEKLDRLNKENEELKQLDADRQRIVEQRDLVEAALLAANATRDEARTLAALVEEVRTDIVRRVFNDQLNDIWRDLFVRLAPDEQFVPAFAIPPEGARSFEVKLETNLRGGAKSGHPKSILSAGNLNTAALTLFLSLHLSVKPILPWLVIDDPVQSMDEIHTAQFAALVRMLARQGRRQVILAVHEKPLFDYLALELTPASEVDRLITIELVREEDRDTRIQSVSKTWDPDTIYMQDQVA